MGAHDDGDVTRARPGERVVVGFDGSQPAREAARYAAAEARTRGMELRLATAYELPTTEMGVSAAPLPWDEEIITTLTTQAENDAEEFAAQLRTEFPELDISTAVLLGGAAGVILGQAEHAALVVLGSHGKEGILGRLLGGVTRQVATHCPVPTVVIRPREEDPAGVVVVGIDGSPDSVHALQFAFDYASRHGLSLRIIHTWDVPPIGAITGVPSPQPPALLQELADNELRFSVEELAGYSQRYPEVAHEVIVQQGSPVRVLTESARDADLLVVGSRGRGGFLGLLLGSVSHGVLNHAVCPVAIVRSDAH